MRGRYKKSTSDGNIQKMGNRHLIEDDPEIKSCIRCHREFMTNDNYDCCEDCLKGIGI